MGKASQYLLIVSVIMSVFYVLGLIGGSGTLIGTIINWAGIQNSALWIGIISAALLAFAGGSAIVTGLFANIKLEQIVTAGATLALFAYFVEILSVFQKIQQVFNTAFASMGPNIGTAISLIICGPIMVFMVFTLFEWWRLKD